MSNALENMRKHAKKRMTRAQCERIERRFGELREKFPSSHPVNLYSAARLQVVSQDQKKPNRSIAQEQNRKRWAQFYS